MLALECLTSFSIQGNRVLLLSYSLVVLRASDKPTAVPMSNLNVAARILKLLRRASHSCRPRPSGSKDSTERMTVTILRAMRADSRKKISLATPASEQLADGINSRDSFPFLHIPSNDAASRPCQNRSAMNLFFGTPDRRHA